MITYFYHITFKSIIKPYHNIIKYAFNAKINQNLKRVSSEVEAREH